MKKILIAGLILLILVVGSFAVMAADEDKSFFSKVIGFIVLNPGDDDLGIQKGILLQQVDQLLQLLMRKKLIVF